MKELLKICVTPVRDEDWILKDFIELNSQWADYIIILDQCSTDRTEEIARSYNNVVYIKNEDSTFDELFRQRWLYREARKFECEKRIIFALDADEYIPPDLLQSGEWKAIEKLEEGTSIFFDWIQIMPNLRNYFKLKKKIAFGYVDDGAEIKGGKIHNDRVPVGEKRYYCEELVNIHLGYVPVIRNYKKHTWYMMWELINKKNTITDINLLYRKISEYSDEKSLQEVDTKWIPESLRIMKLDINWDTVTWWDRDVLKWFEAYNPDYFKVLDMWAYDWNIVSQKAGIYKKSISDPRSAGLRFLHKLVRRTKYHKNLFSRGFHFVLRRFW